MERGKRALIRLGPFRLPREPTPTDLLTAGADLGHILWRQTGGRRIGRHGDREGQRRGITADTALRLARYFGTTPQLWLNLQQTSELRRAEIWVGRQIDERATP